MRAGLTKVYFRLPDEEPIWVGRYGQAHRLMRQRPRRSPNYGCGESQGLGGHHPAPHRGEGDPSGPVFAPGHISVRLDMPRIAEARRPILIIGPGRSGVLIL